MFSEHDSNKPVLSGQIIHDKFYTKYNVKQWWKHVLEPLQTIALISLNFEFKDWIWIYPGPSFCNKLQWHP